MAGVSQKEIYVSANKQTTNRLDRIGAAKAKFRNKYKEDLVAYQHIEKSVVFEVCKCDQAGDQTVARGLLDWILDQGDFKKPNVNKLIRHVCKSQGKTWVRGYLMYV